MTRQELYELVWSKPMTHIAKDYRMSDVAIRKHCVKHGVPTPPVGYWTKVAHGKPVRKTALRLKKRAGDERVYLTVRNIEPRSAESGLAAQEAESKREQLEAALEVPDALPAKPQTVIRSIRTALRRTKADDSGFLLLEEAGLPEICVARASVDRALRILQVLFMVAEQEGHEIRRDEHGFYWVPQGERFLLRVYEIQDRKPHEPTAKELKEQAREDEWRARYLNSYSSSRKVYRTWDHYPSGRLTIALRDTNSYGWREHALSKRWRDRKSNALEGRLADIFTWLEPAAVMAREKRLEIEERQRLEAEEAERLRQLRERREHAGKLEKYLVELVDTHARITQLGELINFLEEQGSIANILIDQFAGEARAYKRVLERRLSDKEISNHLEELGISLGAELLMPVLEQMPEQPRYSWLR